MKQPELFNEYSAAEARARHMAALEGGWVFIPEEERDAAIAEYMDDVKKETLENKPILDSWMKKVKNKKKLKKKIASRVRNNKKNYGITFKLLEEIDFFGLQNIYRGIYNINQPKDMLEAKNAFEILATYMGAYFVKKDDALFDSLEFEPFDRIIGKIDQQAYRRNAKIRTLKNICTGPFSTKKGDLKGRMVSLDDEVKKEFLISFKKPYLHSYQEYKADIMAKRWSDMNYGFGASVGSGYIPKNRYVGAIHDIIQNIYSKNNK